jgi:Rad3-related DNA helicase
MRKNFGEGMFWCYLGDIADRNLVQQCGRAIRAPDDWCEIITLDKKVLSKIPNLWKGNVIIRDMYSRMYGKG